MKKTFLDYLGPEDHFQHSVFDYLFYQYRKKAFFFHVPNESRRTPFERFKAKYLGMIAGVSDWIVVKKDKVLFLELKIKPNKLTESQRVFLNQMEILGFTANVAYTFEEAKEIIDEFMKG